MSWYMPNAHEKSRLSQVRTDDAQVVSERNRSGWRVVNEGRQPGRHWGRHLPPASENGCPPRSENPYAIATPEMAALGVQALDDAFGAEWDILAIAESSPLVYLEANANG